MVNRSNKIVPIVIGTCILAVLYYVSFSFVICSYNVFWDSQAARSGTPHHVIYFSGRKGVNQALYVTFFPCVELTVMSSTDIVFAHSGGFFRGAAEQECLDRRGQDLDERTLSLLDNDRSTIERPIAVIVWGIILISLLSLWCRHISGK
jgi:hypothetical protein